MSLPEQVSNLSDAVCEVVITAASNIWPPGLATDVLSMIDALAESLGQLGPREQTALAPVLDATRTVRALLADPLPSGDGIKPPRAARPAVVAGRHSQAEYWVTRDMRVAETLYQLKSRGGPLAAMFAALPARAMIEAIDRRDAGEDWQTVVKDLFRRHGPGGGIG